MRWNDYFVVGLKLIGLYCLFRGLKGLSHAIPEQLRTLEQLGQVHGVFKVSALISLSIPLIMGALGFYLMRDGRVLHGIPNFDDGMDESKGWIALGIMLFGFYQIASAVPDVLSIIPDLAIVLQAPAYMSTDGSLDRLKSAVIWPSVSLLLGTVCVFRGQVIAASAFRQVSLEQEKDQ